MIAIQQQDFDLQTHYQQLRQSGAGAVVMFVGLVRDFAANGSVTGMYLEHYSPMTEQVLTNIVAEAHQRFALRDVVLIHRVGRLAAHEQIVLVGAASDHRQQAFAAAEFLMDILKQQVPLWKKELNGEQGQWVDAKQSDQQAMQRWESSE